MYVEHFRYHGNQCVLDVGRGAMRQLRVGTICNEVKGPRKAVTSEALSACAGVGLDNAIRIACGVGLEPVVAIP